MSTPGGIRYSHTIGKFSGAGGHGFNNPVDAVLGVNETVYVVSRASDLEEGTRRRVTMCTTEGDYLGEFSGGGSEDGMLAWPVSLASDLYGNIYVSDEALHRISIFDKDGHYLGKWGVQGDGEGEFDRPAGIAFDNEGNLLVVDSANNRVQRYSSDGRFLGVWGSGGIGDGEFNLPWGVSVDQSGNVYVADWRNDRIQKLDGDGRHRATWGATGAGVGEFRRPAGVAVDREGIIYVADWGNERLQVLDPTGAFIAKFRGESRVSNWGQDYLDSNPEERRERENSDLEPELELPRADYLREESASIEKLFWGPTSVKVDDQGRVYVVDSCRHRIQVYIKGG